MEHERRIAIYSRKSRFTGKGKSVENQVQMCRQYLAAHYGAAVAENAPVYEDEGFSGGDLDRPQFKRMMGDARSGAFSGIVVYRLDRISRNIGDFAGLIGQLNALRIDFISIKEQFDTGNPMGRAMMYISSVFSQLERETIAERIRDNMHELAKTGRWLGGNTPTGYGSESVSKMTVDGKPRRSCRLKLIPAEAEMVSAIFEIYLRTDSLTATETELLCRRIRSKTGRDHTRFSIRAILRNPVYLMADEDAYDFFLRRGVALYSDRSAFDGEHGIMAYNRTEQEKGRSTVYLPMTEWIVAVGSHPGLIPSDQWIRVQESLERNKSGAYRKARRNEALLTGLLFCGCGSRMYPRLSGRVNAAGEPVYTYVCKMKERSRKARCAAKNAAGNRLDGAVLGQLGSLMGGEETFIRRMERIRRSYTESRGAHDDPLERPRAELADNDRQMAGLMDALSVVGQSPAVRQQIAGRVEKLAAARRETEDRIRELEAQAAANTLTDGQFDLARQQMAEFGALLEQTALEQKRSAVRALVRKVVWDGQRAHVYLTGCREDRCEDSK